MTASTDSREPSQPPPEVPLLFPKVVPPLQVSAFSPSMSPVRGSPSRPTGRLVYESYSPRTLEEAKEYIRFVMTQRSILPNEVDADQTDPKDCGATDFDFSAEPFGLSFRLTNYLKSVAERRKGTSLARNKRS